MSAFHPIADETYRLYGDQEMRTLVVLMGVLAALFLIASIPVIFLSIFIFDAPGSGSNPLAWALALSIWTAPLAFWKSAEISVECFRQPSRQHLLTALGLLIAPIAAIAASTGLLEVVCDGQFACR